MGKTAVVGAKDRATNQVRAKVVRATDKPTLKGLSPRTPSQAPRSTPTTQRLRRHPQPARDREALSQRVRSGAKRTQRHREPLGSPAARLPRTFHKISPKHLQRYVNEFATRHNMRSQDTIDMMSETVAGMDGKAADLHGPDCGPTGSTQVPGPRSVAVSMAGLANNPDKMNENSDDDDLGHRPPVIGLHLVDVLANRASAILMRHRCQETLHISQLVLVQPAPRSEILEAQCNNRTDYQCHNKE